MPSTRDLPSTIKVGAKSRHGSESPHHDTRSKTTKSTRSRARSKSGHSSTRRRSKSREPSRSNQYEPPEREALDDARNEIPDEGYGEEESCDERDRRRKSSTRDRRRKSSHSERDRSHRDRDKELERSHERSRRERDRSDRRRTSGRSRKHRDYDEDDDEEDDYEEEEHGQYHQFEEVDEDEYDYSKMSRQAPSSDAGAAEEIVDPFNLCNNGGSGSFSDVEPPSRTRRSRRAEKLLGSHPSMDSQFDVPTYSEDHYYQPRQDHSYASIAVSALQLLVLMLQLAMCGVAPLDVNPMVGPFPEAFSEWGGKNAYLILENQEYWRFVTPAFLHVGVLHLLANSFCLLYSSALFEREWGSWTWLFIFLVSEVGCVAVSCIADPDTIAVGSSGALMGLFAAKLAHVLTYTFFETHDMSQDDGIHVDQLSSVLCGLTLVSLLSSFTYVDWSGHMGGLASGFFAGMLVFARPIKSCCGSLFWGFLGLAGIAGTAVPVAYLLMNEVEPEEDLADACEYFRNLFPEGYTCGCFS